MIDFTNIESVDSLKIVSTTQAQWSDYVEEVLYKTTISEISNIEEKEPLGFVLDM